jgi:hypothetical protein
MDVSPLWLQAMLLTFVVGFAILGYLALRAHSDHAPVPGRVVDESGRPGTGLLIVALLAAARVAVRDARSVWRPAVAPEDDGPA